MQYQLTKATEAFLGHLASSQLICKFYLAGYVPTFSMRRESVEHASNEGVTSANRTLKFSSIYHLTDEDYLLQHVEPFPWGRPEFFVSRTCYLQNRGPQVSPRAAEQGA